MKCKNSIFINNFTYSIFLLFITTISIVFFFFSLPFSYDKNPLLHEEHSYTTSMPSSPRKLIQNSSQESKFAALLVVSKDVGGKYKTVQSAVEATEAVRKRSRNHRQRIEIHVKAGVYNETVVVPKNLDDLTMVGDGIGMTIISGSNSVARGYTTFTSATFSVFGDRFIAKDLTIRNTYGPGSQAVALLSTSDRSVFYRCSIEGYQDTLYVHRNKQFYRECDIYGTIDFIFGNAAAVIQKCNIYLREPGHGGGINVVTAQGRSDPRDETGIVIQFSHITASPELLPVRKRVRSFLGRPWKAYSRTVFIKNTIDDVIDPVGWSPMNGKLGIDTLYYAEYRNVGKGSRWKSRVKWSGYHKANSCSSVERFTVANFIDGGAWLPATGVPFNLGL